MLYVGDGLLQAHGEQHVTVSCLPDVVIEHISGYQISRATQGTRERRHGIVFRSLLFDIHIHFPRSIIIEEMQIKPLDIQRIHQPSRT